MWNAWLSLVYAFKFKHLAPEKALFTLILKSDLNDEKNTKRLYHNIAPSIWKSLDELRSFNYVFICLLQFVNAFSQYKIPIEVKGHTTNQKAIYNIINHYIT